MDMGPEKRGIRAEGLRATEKRGRGRKSRKDGAEEAGVGVCQGWEGGGDWVRVGFWGLRGTAGCGHVRSPAVEVEGTILGVKKEPGWNWFKGGLRGVSVDHKCRQMKFIRGLL